MRLEIYCEACGNKLLEEDIDTRNPSPIYIPQCSKCISQLKEDSNAKVKDNN